MLFTNFSMDGFIRKLDYRTLTYGVTIVLYVLFRLLKSVRTKRKVRALGVAAPSPPHSLPFGVDLLITALRKITRHEFSEWTRELLDIPGRTISMDLLSAQIILTADTENTKAVLSTKFSQFGKGEDFHHIWHDLMKDSVFATDGALWHSNKDYLRNYTAKSRPSDLDVTETHVKILLDKLSDDCVHDCLEDMDRFVLDLVSDVFFGESAGTQLTAEQPLRDAVEEMYEWNTRKSLLGRLGALLPGNAAASKVLDDYLDVVINRAVGREDFQSEEGMRARSTMLVSLLAQGTDKTRVKDQMLAILIGGKDPGAIVLVWIMYDLARHPEIMQRLRQEIHQTIGFDSLPTPKQLKSVTLLQNVIKEALRLHTPLGFNIRTAKADTSLPRGGGKDGQEPVAVLQGTHVIMSYSGIQCRPDIVGPTADEFDPDRWNSWTPALWEFLPFNHGPRICLGRNFAWTMMEYTVCRLCQTFEQFELVGRKAEDRMKVKIALNTKPAEAVMLRFRKSL
ncbi:hypothetical protein BFW01_g1894 [Lasiodiplodia theobromae]|uniref:Cytochrome P450 52A13 n=1 Tax=Lasiodiplodia theobromae TaxID=45133 RepID=A0A8H7ISU6_9PEZI|nr:hypothetical protein BFW01_g1894 [Lasiodiplodia theobromae]